MSLLNYAILPHENDVLCSGGVQCNENDVLCSVQQVEASKSPGQRGCVAGVEEEPDGVTTVEEVLTQLNLDSLVETFQKEQIDFDSLVS